MCVREDAEAPKGAEIEPDTDTALPCDASAESEGYTVINSPLLDNRRRRKPARAYLYLIFE